MKKKILIVDDALFMRKMIRKILEEIGCTEITEAQDGEEAILKYDEIKPDLILMDITMPQMSGVEALEKIMEKNPNQQIIMCSAVGQEMMIQKAVEMGAADFIVKPFDKEKFQKVVERYLQ